MFQGGSTGRPPEEPSAEGEGAGGDKVNGYNRSSGEGVLLFECVGSVFPPMLLVYKCIKILIISLISIQLHILHIPLYMLLGSTDTYCKNTGQHFSSTATGTVE